MYTEQNPPAFPRSHNAASGHNGMELRDYFAAQVLPVIVADLAQDRNNVSPPSDMPRLAAKGAYLYADAMLAARS